MISMLRGRSNASVGLLAVLLQEVFMVGGIMAVVYYAIFGTVGMLWWKLIGMY